MAKKWSSTSLRLSDDHTWRSKEGYVVFVIDRGAVRFDIPEGWTVLPEAGTVKLHDKPPPDDDCRLQVSVFYLPQGIDWSELQLPMLLSASMKDDEPDERLLSLGEIVHVTRRDLELAWRETRYTDENEQREARSRTCIARGANIQPLITLDYWPEDAARLEPVWDEVLRTLRLGEYVRDPLTGPVRPQA